MNLRNVLALRLRELMDAKPDLDTQAKLAKRAKVSQSTVNRIIDKQSSATVDTIEALSKAFGVTPSELLMLDKREAELLRVFNLLNEDEKFRILGYLHVSASSAMRHHPSAQLEFDSGRSVTPSLQAASHRASARRPGSGAEFDATEHNEKEGGTHRKRGNT